MKFSKPSKPSRFSRIFQSISTSPSYIIFWNTTMKPAIHKTLLTLTYIAFFALIIYSITLLFTESPTSTEELKEAARLGNPKGELIKAPECKY